MKEHAGRDDPGHRRRLGHGHRRAHQRHDRHLRVEPPDEGQGEGRRSRRSAGRRAVETKVALDALAVYVNDKSPLKEISIPAPREDLHRRDEELEGRRRARRTRSSSTAARTTPARTATSRSTCSRTRTSPQRRRRSPARRAVVNAVKGDEFGIGYGGIAYLEGIRALKVKKDDALAGHRAVARDRAERHATRSAAFSTSTRRASRPGTIKKFIDWVVGRRRAEGHRRRRLLPAAEEVTRRCNRREARPRRREAETPSLRSCARRASGERVAESAVKVVALTSIAAVLLILVFVGKEALPLLTSAEVHQR